MNLNNFSIAIIVIMISEVEKPKAYIFAEGTMANLIKAFSWNTTPVGPISCWPTPLLTMVNQILDSSFPMFIWWGQEQIQFYNDAYLQILGSDENSKHPKALGQSGEGCWPEIWGVISPLLKQVLYTAKSVYLEDQLIPIYRQGRLDDIYWTFSYNVIRNTDGTTGGVLVVCSETTQKVKFQQDLTSVNKELAASNEKLVITNEKVINANQELTCIVDELAVVQQRLKGTIKQLEESEERFRVMAEGTDVLIAVGDETGSATYFNKAWTDNTGKNSDDLIKYGWVDLMHPEDKERVLGIFGEAFAERNPWSWEFRLLNKEGQHRWLLARGIPRFRSDGSFAGYISSSVDITQIKQDEQRKTDFIGMVSHELKTPLTSLAANLQLLQVKAKKSEDGFEINAVNQAVKQTRKMTAMINSFLNVSRLESGEIHIRSEKFDLVELLKETQEEMTMLYTAHHFDFIPCETLIIFADYDKIGHVLNNILSNACKYSEKGSTVKLICTRHKDKIIVSVSDQGVGIKKEDIDRLFERYYRVENNGTVSGFGIGLYLCVEIIKRHKGKIWVESDLGRGSTFHFSIPV